MTADLAHALMQHQIRLIVQRGCVAVDKNDVPPAEEPQQRRSRIHRQARSSDDKQFRLLQLTHRCANCRIIKPFLV